MRKNKTYRGKLTKHQKKTRQQKIIAFILFLFIAFGGYWNWAMYMPDYAVAEVNVPKREKDDKSIQEHIWLIMTNEFNLSFEEKIKAMSIINCESHWYPYAINKNKNGTYDLGLWQINDIHKVSRACRFDVYCSTRWAINKYLKDKNWNAWYCK